jgi:hypothetical protein
MGTELSADKSPKEMPSRGGLDGEVLAPETAIEQLARLLFWKMEHLDPTENYDWDKTPEENWDRLNEGVKSIYRTSIGRLAVEHELWRAAFSPQPFANHNRIYRA